jgi:hypothetical protein
LEEQRKAIDRVAVREVTASSPAEHAVQWAPIITTNDVVENLSMAILDSMKLLALISVFTQGYLSARPQPTLGSNTSSLSRNFAR